jgi:hypothetical protein
VGKHFEDVPAARIAIEAGTHSIWNSEQLARYGHEVIVANVSELHAIVRNIRKSDQVDAEKLARYARLDPRILRPIAHRSVKAQQELTVVRARDVLVRRLFTRNSPRKPVPVKVIPGGFNGVLNAIYLAIKIQLHLGKLRVGDGRNDPVKATAQMVMPPLVRNSRTTCHLVKSCLEFQTLSAFDCDLSMRRPICGRASAQVVELVEVFQQIPIAALLVSCDSSCDRTVFHP